MRTLTLLLTATLLVLVGAPALVEPGFNIIPIDPIKCAALTYDSPPCLADRRGEDTR